LRQLVSAFCMSFDSACYEPASVHSAQIAVVDHGIPPLYRAISRVRHECSVAVLLSCEALSIA
jgi:hypothetical protein